MQTFEVWHAEKYGIDYGISGTLGPDFKVSIVAHITAHKA